MIYPFIVLCIVLAVLFIPVGPVARKVLGVIALIVMILWLLLGMGYVTVKV